jgi:hypothetical protein
VPLLAQRWRPFLLLLVPLGFGLYAVRLGRDANWDLQNYHWYDAYAWLTGRSDRDLALARGMSFYVPYVYVPWYLLGTWLPARALGFVIGAVQSVNMLLLYGLGRRLLPIASPLWREATALLVAFAGMTGGMSMGLLGTTFADSIMSLGILGSLLMLVAWQPALRKAPAHEAAWRVALCAVPAALALAGKMTAMPFIAGLAAGFVVLEATPARRLWLLLWFGIAGTLVSALTLGPWLWHVYAATGDPFFPLYARSVHSPLGGDGWTFNQWMPHSRRELIVYPLVIARDGTRVAEVPFTDWRFALAYLLVPAALLLRVLMQPGPRPPLPAGARMLLATMAVGYALWLFLFSYYRYAVTLELLAPLAIALAIFVLPLPALLRAAALGAVLVTLALTTHAAKWGRLPWSKRFIEVSVPPIDSPATATVLLLRQPISYIVPSLPPAVAVADLDLASWGGGNPQAWQRLIRAKLAARGGPVYGVINVGGEGALAEAAAPFGLTLQAAGCRPMPSNMPSAGMPQYKQLLLCPFSRQPG